MRIPKVVNRTIVWSSYSVLEKDKKPLAKINIWTRHNWNQSKASYITSPIIQLIATSHLCMQLKDNESYASVFHTLCLIIQQCFLVADSNYATTLLVTNVSLCSVPWIFGEMTQEIKQIQLSIIKSSHSVWYPHKYLLKWANPAWTWGFSFLVIYIAYLDSSILL